MGLGDAELWAVVLPIVIASALVLYVIGRRLEDGVPLSGLLIDRKFLTTFFYSGALVAIWLSCYHFYGVLSRAGR